jgi:phosphoribulokinase
MLFFATNTKIFFSVLVYVQFLAEGLVETMSNFGRVPVIDVHNENLREVWPSMILALSNATFVGLDTVIFFIHLNF